MIIPKAMFLKQSYLKNKETVNGLFTNEKTLIAGQLATALRNPQTHKYGLLTCFFAKGSYPILASGLCHLLITSLIADFENAGYLVKVEDREDGVAITLDWRDLSDAKE